MRALYNKPPSTRQLKVSAEITREISVVLSNKTVFIPSLESTMITVSQTKVSADLQLATIYIMLPDASNKDKIVKELNDNSYLLSTAIAKRLQLKYNPKLRFKHDDNWEQISRVEGLFEKITSE